MSSLTPNLSLFKWDVLIDANSEFNIDTALNGNWDKIDTAVALKSPLASPTFTGTVVLPATTSIGNVSNTEIGYLDGVTSTIQTQINNKSDITGWNSAGETWTYSSTDDPTGVITISGNVTTKYSIGMRIKFTNGGNTISGIITKTEYSAPNTLMTFLHEIDPSDSQALYLMANSAITNNYYSLVKTPYGFPMDKSKWTISVADTNALAQTTPTQNTWYNIKTIVLPIGSWDTEVETVLAFAIGGVAGYGSCFVTLSTANNTAGTSKLNTGTYQYIPWTTGQSTGLGCYMKDNITVTSKSTYYLNIQTTDANVALIRSGSNAQGLTIKAICAYL